jgi:hypothetical protein
MASAAPIRPGAPASSACATAWRQSAERSSSRAPPEPARPCWFPCHSIGPFDSPRTRRHKRTALIGSTLHHGHGHGTSLPRPGAAEPAGDDCTAPWHGSRPFSQRVKRARASRKQHTINRPSTPGSRACIPDSSPYSPARRRPAPDIGGTPRARWAPIDRFCGSTRTPPAGRHQPVLHALPALRPTVFPRP